MYLSPMSGPRRAWRHPHVGWIITPVNDSGIADDVLWAADCGLAVARNASPAATAAYLDWLASRPHDRRRALFAVAPDILADARATLTRALPCLATIRAMGYPVAFVTQDGCHTGLVPWGSFDVLFVGGTDTWKLSEASWGLCGNAKRRGLRVHMGRVNSFRRLRACAIGGVDTADGTYLKFGPDKNWPRLVSWLDEVNNGSYMELLA